MLIHAHHAQIGELHSECLRFQFEEAPFRLRVGALTHRFSRNRHAPEDFPNLVRVAKGVQGLAQLSPECGSRFSFWLPPPASSVTIVIGRVNSLGRSQRMALQIGAARSRLPVNIAHTFITLGSFRLLFIPPEELVTRYIRDDLNRLIERRGIHALLIDQVHRMAEERLDFSPSYLRLPTIINELIQSAPDLTVLAMTRENSREIRETIKQHLQLESFSFPCQRDFYRPLNSHHVVAAYDPKEKLDRYHKMAFETLPKQFVDAGAQSVSLRSLPPYTDPYRAVLESKENTAAMASVHHRSIDTFLHSSRTSPEKTGVLIQTSLSDSLENWLFQTAEAGSSKELLHCIRIADLPNEACEADMRQHGRRNPLCDAMRCPFERDELCDYGKQHHLIQKTLPHVQASVTGSIKLLNLLIEAFNKGNTPAVLPVLPEEEHFLNITLHHLLQLRLFDIYFADRRRSPRVFKVYGFSPDFHEEAAQAALLKFFQRCDATFLKQYSRMSIETLCADTGEIARWKDRFVDTVSHWVQKAASGGDLDLYSEYARLFETVGFYVFIMVSNIRETMADRAYNRAWNLKSFFGEQDCRYQSLLRTIGMTSENWQCGRCDFCSPGGNPGREPHMPYIQSDQTEELDTLLSQWLENDEAGFDALSADQIVEHSTEFIKNIKKRSDRLLEKYPQNLKALYLAHELCSDDEKKMYAHDLMLSACRSLPLLSIIRLYDTLRSPGDFKRLFFEMFDDEFGRFNAPSGERWLSNEAEKLGLNNDRVSLLKQRSALNSLLEVDFSAAQKKLHQLTKEI